MHILFLCTNAEQVTAIFPVSAWILITIFVSSPFEFSRRAGKRGDFSPPTNEDALLQQCGHN